MAELNWDDLSKDPVVDAGLSWDNLSKEPVEDKPWHDDAKEVARQTFWSIGKGIPLTMLKAARGIVTATGDDLRGDITSRLTEAIDFYDNEDAREITKPDLKGRGLISETLIKGASNIGPSLAGMAATAINPVVGGAAVFGAFGGAQYDDTYQRGISSGLSDSKAKEAALLTGLIEGGGEAVADLFGMKALKATGDLIAGGTKEAMRRVTDTRFMVPYLRNQAENVAIQSSTEYGQGAGQAATEAGYGIRDESGKLPDWHEQGKEGFQAGIGMSILLAPFGITGQVQVRNQNIETVNALQTADAPIEHRAAAARRVYSSLAAEDKEVASAWAKDAGLKIAAGQQIEIALPKPPAPKVNEIAAAPNLDQAFAVAEAALSAPIETTFPDIEDIEGPQNVGIPQWTSQQPTNIAAPSLQSTPLELPQGLISQPIQELPSESPQAIQSQSSLQEVSQATPEAGAVPDQLSITQNIQPNSNDAQVVSQPTLTTQGDNNALQVQRQEAAQEVVSQGEVNVQGAITTTAETLSTGVQNEGETVQQSENVAEGVPGNTAKGEVGYKKGILSVEGSSTLDVRHALAGLKAPFNTFSVEQKRGKIVVTAPLDRYGKPVKITINQKNQIRDALFGKEIKTPKKRTYTGNLRNDLNLLYPGLYGEVESGGDGEKTGKFDMGMIAELLRDEYGYSQIPQGDAKDAGEALIGMIREGGAVNEERMLAEKQADDEKAYRAQLEELTSEYGIEIRKGIMHRGWDTIEAEVKAEIERDLGQTSELVASEWQKAIDAGMSDDEILAIATEVSNNYAEDKRLNADVLLNREQAEKLNEAWNRKLENEENDNGRANEEAANARQDQPDAGEAEETRPALELATQSEEDLAAQAARVAAAKEAEEAEAREAEAKAKKEQAEKDRADIQQRLANQPFEFGVGAKEAKTVQRDLLNSPEPQKPLEQEQEKPDNPQRREVAPIANAAAPKGAVSVSEAKILEQADGKTITRDAIVAETGQQVTLKDQDAVSAIKQIRNDIQALEALRLCIGG